MRQTQAGLRKNDLVLDDATLNHVEIEYGYAWTTAQVQCSAVTSATSMWVGGDQIVSTGKSLACPAMGLFGRPAPITMSLYGDNLMLAS